MSKIIFSLLLLNVTFFKIIGMHNNGRKQFYTHFKSWKMNEKKKNNKKSTIFNKNSKIPLFKNSESIKENFLILNKKNYRIKDNNDKEKMCEISISSYIDHICCKNSNDLLKIDQKLENNKFNKLFSESYVSVSDNKEEEAQFNIGKDNICKKKNIIINDQFSLDSYDHSTVDNLTPEKSLPSLEIQSNTKEDNTKEDNSLNKIEKIEDQTQKFYWEDSIAKSHDISQIKESLQFSTILKNNFEKENPLDKVDNYVNESSSMNLLDLNEDADLESELSQSSLALKNHLEKNNKLDETYKIYNESSSINYLNLNRNANINSESEISPLSLALKNYLEEDNKLDEAYKINNYCNESSSINCLDFNKDADENSESEISPLSLALKNYLEQENKLDEIFVIDYCFDLNNPEDERENLPEYEYILENN